MTKHVQGIKRGARVKAMAICTRFRFLHAFRSLLLLALERYFAAPSISILKLIYDVVNSMDWSSIPELSTDEVSLLRNGNPTIVGELLERRQLCESNFAFDGFFYRWEAKCNILDVNLSLRLPVGIYKEELGDVFCCFLL